MNRQMIRLVSGYESKLVIRSFLFRVLLVFAVVGITWLQWLLQGKVPSDWLLSCQQFSFPLVHAYLYNIVQSFVLLFVATEVFSREQQRGPLETFHARPVGNGELLLGKALGLLEVFLSVGFLSMLLLMGINIFGSFAPFNVWYYLYYFLTLTFPSLLFFLGLSLWLVWQTRSRVLTQFLLLLFLYVSVVVFPGKFHGLFDFTGSGLSNVFSSVSGHVDGRNYLLHRLSYLLIGFGLVFLTICLHRRLPNAVRSVRFACGLGLLSLFLGLFSGFLFSRVYLAESSARDSYRLSFSRHASFPSCRVSRHSITLEQRGSELLGTSDLTLRNPGMERLSRLVLYLNPGLRVEGVNTVSGEAVSFERDGQVLLLDRALGTGDSVRLYIRYVGELDERVAYLELSDEEYYDTRRGGNFFHLGRRHALVSDGSLVLVPELMWYPVSVAPVNPVHPSLTERDYTLYRLRVVRPRQRVLLSQGDRFEVGDTLLFVPPRSLEGLTLCGGDYECKRMNLNGLQVEWYHFPGHDFVTPVLEATDTAGLLNIVNTRLIRIACAVGGYVKEMPTCLSEAIFRRDWYTGEGSRLQIVETPLSFVSHARVWQGRSEYVQPGMLLTGERGMGMDMETLLRVLRSIEMKREVNLWFLSSLFDDSFSPLMIPVKPNSFLARLHFYEPYTGSSLRLNPYYAVSLFTESSVKLVGERGLAVECALRYFLGRLGDSDGRILKTSFPRDRLMAYAYAQEHSLAEALGDNSLSSNELNHVLDLETAHLLSLVGRHVRLKEFSGFLRTFYAGRHGEIPLDTLICSMQKSLGFDFDDVLREWERKSITGYRMEDLKMENIGWGQYAVRFRIQNTGEQPGRIFLHDAAGKTWTQTLCLQPGESKRVSWLVHFNTARLNLGISRNFPFQLYVL